METRLSTSAVVRRGWVVQFRKELLALVDVGVRDPRTGCEDIRPSPLTSNRRPDWVNRVPGHHGRDRGPPHRQRCLHDGPVPGPIGHITWQWTLNRPKHDGREIEQDKCDYEQ